MTDQTLSAILTLLTRIYDIQMALLNDADPDTADKVYDAHERGETFNPPIYLMEMEPNDEFGTEG